MCQEYTVIYNEFAQAGSHRNVSTKLRRLQLKADQTLRQALDEAEIADRAVFIFQGYAPLVGQAVAAQEEARVLVAVRGGVAETAQSGPVKVAVFDWDNSEDVRAGVPAEFRALADQMGVPVI